MKNSVKIVSALASAAIASAPMLAMAQAPSTVSGVISLLNGILGIFKVIFGIAAVFFIIYAAFLYLTAAGNEEKVKKAGQQLLYAVIAIAIFLVAEVLPSLISSVLGQRG